MAIRKIVQIDEEKCTGCGECIPDCAEGALRIIDGKARLVSDRYCDGLGACLGACPEGAISIVEREAQEFDEQAVAEVRSHQAAASATHHAGHSGPCPGAAPMDIPRERRQGSSDGPQAGSSALSQWPVQLQLVPVRAPFFEGADLLLAADCVPFALAEFHDQLLQGRKLLVGCPKLDDPAYYTDKLTAILKQNNIRSLTVVHMEVPCCSGLMGIARRALSQCGKQVPLECVVVSLRGEIKEERPREEEEVTAGGRSRHRVGQGST